jgi:hypothetical protein
MTHDDSCTKNVYTGRAQDALRFLYTGGKNRTFAYQAECGWFVKVRHPAASCWMTDTGVAVGVPADSVFMPEPSELSLMFRNQIYQQRITEISKSITIPEGRVEWPVITMCCSALNLAITLNKTYRLLNPLNAELNPIRHLLALAGARHIVHGNRVRVNTRKFEWEGIVSRVRK